MSGLKIMIAERDDNLKYTYTAEVEIDADIYTSKEYLDNCMRQAVDELGESQIEEREDNV